MANFPVHTLESAPADSKPALNGLAEAEVDPRKRTPILLKRRCRNGQASYPVPGGIPGANG